MYRFPKDFLWGAATSAYQMEGGNKNDWSAWEKGDAGRAADHYNRFEEDFDLARSLGHNAHRFSLEWSRIEPKEGKFDAKEIEHYRRVIAALRERGMEPFVTLWHFTLPLWVKDKGGVLSPEFPTLFTSFARRMAEEYAGDVRFWITVNEPNVYASSSYLRGVWPPHRRSFCAHERAVRSMATAHKGASAAMKEVRSDLQIGVAKNVAHIDMSVFSRPVSWWWNHRFLAMIADHQDFVGINHYLRMGFGRAQTGAKRPRSDVGWELNPESIEHAVREMRRYNKPLIITENGLADARDKYRPWFLRETLKHLLRAKRQGADVRGYLHWSLLDNFEWEKGCAPRFGLLEVDYATMKRTPRPSSYLYRDIIKRGTIEE